VPHRHISHSARMSPFKIPIFTGAKGDDVVLFIKTIEANFRSMERDFEEKEKGRRGDLDAVLKTHAWGLDLVYEPYLGYTGRGV